MKLVVTGGGTGGHLYPALAVIEELLAIAPDTRILYAGGRDSIESRVAAERGLSFTEVSTRKLGSLMSIRSGATFVALLRGVREAAAMIARECPAAVFATGGYVAAATSLAACLRRVPLVLHEQNAIPGRTNRLVARWAKRICVSFEGSVGPFPRGRTVVTGLPLRREVRERIPKPEARAAFGLGECEFTLLAMGGSQGSRFLNQRIAEAAIAMGNSVQVIHQTGPNNVAAVRQSMERSGVQSSRYVAAGFLGDPDAARAYCAADLVACRCGASTLFEAALHGLPLLMVPLPSAYADHQTANARRFEQAGAGRLLREEGLTGDNLAELVVGLKNDLSARERMSRASLAQAREDAASRVCLELSSVVH